LFVQRVQARHPEFIVNEANLGVIVDICQRLDGLPLAIELAAAQVRLLSPDQALPQLEHGLKALRDISRDRPLRQRTLWDAIDWSYQLLFEPEKAILRRLAVFGREWSLEAAREVCQMDDLLASLQELADKNLLRYAGSGEDGKSRFQMLQPIREYALEQLANSAEMLQTQRRHASYFLELVERAEPAVGTPEQLHWVRRIKQERENLQIALQWMLDKQETEMAFKLLGAVWRYYNMLNIWDETKSWMERALAQGAHLESAARVKTLWGASWLATHYNDLAQQMILAEQGLALAREIGDKLLIGLLLQNVGDGFRRRKQYDQAILLLEESLSLFRQMDNYDESAWVLYHIADTFWDRGERARSMEIRQESLAIFRAIGDQWSVASILRQIGLLALEDGDEKLAVEAMAESLEIFRVIGAKQLISDTLYHLASLVGQQGDFEPVKAMIEESLALSREVGDQMGIARALNFQGRLALQQLNFAAARELFEKAQVIFQQIGDQSALANNLEYLKRLALIEKGDLKD
jgi:tetratricopeptide (TPR) repeat protein